MANIGGNSDHSDNGGGGNEEENQPVAPEDQNMMEEGPGAGGGSDPNPSSTSSSSSSSSPSSSSSSSSSSPSSSSSDDDDFVPMQDHPIPEDGIDPLYDGAPLSKLQSFLMIHQHMNQFHPSRVEKESLLRLISAHCPQENHCFQSLSSFENFLNNGENYSTIHEYCGKCFHLYEQDEIECPDCAEPRWLGSKSAFLLVVLSIRKKKKEKKKEEKRRRKNGSQTQPQTQNQNQNKKNKK